MDWLVEMDRSLFRDIHTLRTPWLDPIFIAVTSTGLGWVQALALAAWALVSKLRSGRVPSLVLHAFFAGVLSGLVRLLIVRWAGRERPSNFDFAEPLESVFGHSSFPSGHTTTSFAIAAMLLLSLRGRSAWVGWAVLAWACLIGFSRVYVGVHYPTDVLGGAALGLACGALAFMLVNRREGPTPNETEG